MRRTDRPGLKAVYTVLELAEMSNVTKGVMRRMLERCQVEFIRSGGIDYVVISELEQNCNSLWQSSKLLYHFRNIEREHQASITAKLEEVELNR